MAVARAHGNLSGVSGASGAVRYRIGRGSSAVVLAARSRSRRPSASEASHRRLFAEAVRAWQSAPASVQQAWIEGAAALGDPGFGFEGVNISGYGWFMRERLIFGGAGLSPPSVPVVDEQPLDRVNVRAFPNPSTGQLSLELQERPVLPFGADGFLVFYIGNFGGAPRSLDRNAWRVLQVWPLSLGVPGFDAPPVASGANEIVGGGVGFWIGVRVVSPGVFSSARSVGAVEVAPEGSSPLFRVWRFGGGSVALELRPSSGLYRAVFDKGSVFETESVMDGVGPSTDVGDVMHFFGGQRGLEVRAAPGADLSLPHGVQSFRPLEGLSAFQQPRLSFTA